MCGTVYRSTFLIFICSSIEDFIGEEPRETVYLHGFVVLLTPVTTLARHSIYELFFMNISETVLELVNEIHFRFFISSRRITNSRNYDHNTCVFFW